ncbi:Protein of unknown function (DUF3759) domain containing protein [Tylopilus felleus]
MTQEAWNQVMNAEQPHHKAKLSHELIAAAAAYEATKAWNEHKRKQGVDVSHATAKEIMAAASAAFIDRVIETKGLDAIDRHKAKKHAHHHHDQELNQYYQQ